ncbi:MAG: hypothetical protein AAF604_12790 [Acidobacteriota bacterium]
MRRRLCWIAPLLLAVACSNPDPSQVAPLMAEQQVLLQQDVSLAGRPFRLAVVGWQEEWPLASGQSFEARALTVTGDDRLISFSSSTGPFDLTIEGGRLEFGGHTLEATDQVGRFLADGQAVELSPRLQTLHVFFDGTYLGPWPF